MKEEDFIKVWKDSDRDRILHQYYYDYLEMQRLNHIIDELEKYLIFQIRHTDKEHIFGEVYYKLKELKEEDK